MRISTSEESSQAPFCGAVCLITGGAGAIGSNLTKKLLRAGAEVMVLDNFSSGYISNFPNDSGYLTIIHGDVNSDKALDAAFKCKPDFVFHLAAQFANQNSVDHPVEDFATNANGTIRVLEYCRQSEGLLRMVYASSSCVLGRHHGKVTEGTRVAPETPYAVSKLTGELYALTFYRVFGLPTTVVRYFNVYGPGERPGQYRNVLPNFIQRALCGQPLIITGTGEETREFVFVDDAVRATLLAAASPTALGEVFHVGSGHLCTIRELAERVCTATGGTACIEYAPRRRWDTIPHRRTTFAKARRLLGYEPQVSLDEGLRRTVAWIRTLNALPSSLSAFPIEKRIPWTPYAIANAFRHELTHRNYFKWGKRAPW